MPRSDLAMRCGLALLVLCLAVITCRAPDRPAEIPPAAPTTAPTSPAAPPVTIKLLTPQPLGTWEEPPIASKWPTFGPIPLYHEDPSDFRPIPLYYLDASDFRPVRLLSAPHD